MKILLVSDIHSDYLPARVAGQTINPDFVLDCGDHTEMKNLFEFAPHYFIRGNHEPDMIYLPIDQMPLPHRISPGEQLILGGEDYEIKVAGLEGNYADPSKDHAVTIDNIDRLKCIPENGLDIILTHESPVIATEDHRHKNIANRLLYEIDRIKPKYVFSGHSNNFDDSLRTPDGVQNIVLDDMAKGYCVLNINKEWSIERVKSRYR